MKKRHNKIFIEYKKKKQALKAQQLKELEALTKVIADPGAKTGLDPRKKRALKAGGESKTAEKQAQEPPSAEDEEEDESGAEEEVCP